jgi:pyrophosphatase PpaX
LADCYRALAPDLDPTPLCADHRAWQRDRLHLVKPFLHAVETLRALRAAGVRLAAVTARSKVSSLQTVDRAGFGDLLEVTVSAEDAARPKPHPEGLLAALGHLGVPADAAAMVGDTEVDILAGRAAGTATIGALYGFHGPQLAACRPDHLLRDIRELLKIVLSS